MGIRLKPGRPLLIAAALLLLLCKLLIKDKRLYEAPAKDQPPPVWIREPAAIA